MDNKEIELRISDLLAMLLKSIKTILCFALILGLLGGAYDAFSVLKKHPQVTQEDVEAAELNAVLAENSLIRAKAALSFRDEVTIPDAERKAEQAGQTVQQLQEYRENSIYYKLNPFHCGTARLRFTVETDYVVIPELAVQAVDPRIGIVNAYIGMYPFDSEIIDEIQKIIGTETPLQYINELISVANTNNYIVEIRVFYDDLEIAEKIVNYLYQIMTKRGAEKLPEHQAKVLTVFSGYESHFYMNDNQKDFEERLISAETAFTHANKSYQALLSERAEKAEEQAVLEATENLATAQAALQKVQSYAAKAQPNIRSLIKNIIKHGLLCGLIGIVLGCCYALMKGLFGGIIQNQNEVMSRYAFPLIGVLPRTKKVWFDNTIRKLEGEPTGNFEATAQATAQSLLSRIGDRSVCIVSTSSNAIAQKLASYTEDTVPVIGNIINNAEAVKKLADYTGIVLVEERGKSRVDLVDAQILRAKALNKEIIGIVLA